MKKLMFFLLMVAEAATAEPLSTFVKPTESLILADKKGGKIYVYNVNERSLHVGPALFGKRKADAFRTTIDQSQVTPAGEFKAAKVHSEHLNDDAIVFARHGDYLLAIHPVWLGTPSQRRVQRLESSSPIDNRITNGCINVSRDFFYDHVNKLPNNTSIIILTERETIEDDITGTQWITANNPKITYTQERDNIASELYPDINLEGNPGEPGLVYNIDKMKI